MPDRKAHIDPEALLRDAITAVAVTAFSQGIGVLAHVDCRMARRVTPRDPRLGAFLRRGLQRTVEASRTRKISLALWHLPSPDGNGEALLEVARSLLPDEPPVTRLADLWALPLEGGTARPQTRREDAHGEAVVIPLHLSPAPDALPVAAQWGNTFAGKRLLETRDVLLDPERLADSLAALGAGIAFAGTPDQAPEALREAAAAGRPVDLVILEARAGGARAVEIARNVRSDPALAGVRLVLANAPRDGKLSGKEAALFDAVASSPAPRRSMLDVMQRVFARAAEQREGGPVFLGGETASLASPGRDDSIPALQGRRILIAEDVATNRMLLEAILSPTGAALEVVHEGASALARHRAQPADLILMDLQMPGTGGIEALHNIRALGGAVGGVPIVALTAYAREADRRAALEAGMDAYLAKPLVVSEFYDLLTRLLPAPVE